MKKVDARLGPPLCRLAALTAKLGILRPISRGAAGGQVRSVLLIKLWGLGSLVNLTPALELAHHSHPTARITLVTLERNRGLGALLPFCDEVIYLNDKKGPRRLLRDVPRVLRALRRKQFDVVIDAEFLVHFTALLAFFTGARRRVGFSGPRPARSRLYTDLVPLSNQKHISLSFADLVLTVSGENETGPFSGHPQLLPLYREEDLSLPAFDREKKLVLVNPNASELSLLRRWPKERFASLCDVLIEEFSVQIAFIGTREECPYTESVRALMRHGSLDWCGKTSLPALVELMRRADLVVSNDSGPLHLAVAAGAPTISFFGPETPTLYGPRGPRHRVFYRAIACSPCLTALNNKTSYCQNNVCLQAIGDAEVLRAARELLHGSGKPLAHISLQPTQPQ